MRNRFQLVSVADPVDRTVTEGQTNERTTTDEGWNDNAIEDDRCSHSDGMSVPLSTYLALWICRYLLWMAYKMTGIMFGKFSSVQCVLKSL